jgi:transcriptional regulator with XRE-family HTH domain
MPESKFAARLKELRESAGLTQQELADKVGLSLGAIRHLEQGLNEARFSTINALAEALGVNCLAFNQEPGQMSKAKRGRPRKPAPDTPAAPKRPRGRPRKNG